MYELIKRVIESGNYKLDEITEKIKRLWIMGDIDEAQMDELVALAREKAPNTQEGVEARLTACEAVTGKVDSLLREEIESGDKLGTLLRVTYLGDVRIRAEYIPDPDAQGTADNPIPYASGVPLIQGAHYMQDGIRKVWTGDNGAVAPWDDPGFIDW